MKSILKKRRRQNSKNWKSAHISSSKFNPIDKNVLFQIFNWDNVPLNYKKIVSAGPRLAKIQKWPYKFFNKSKIPLKMEKMKKKLL
jgi:hypothetical protein